MKKVVIALAIGGLLAAGVQQSQAGDREWSVAGKVLTGVVAGSIIARAFEPQPVYTYSSATIVAPAPVVYQQAPQVVYQPAPVAVQQPAPVAEQQAPQVVQQQPAPQVVYTQPAPQVIYAQPPQVVYVQPAPVYVRPPVYYAPGPVVSFRVGVGHHRPYHW